MSVKKVKVLFDKDIKFLISFVSSTDNIKTYCRDLSKCKPMLRPDIVVIDFESFSSLYKKRRRIEKFISRFRIRPYVIAYNKSWDSLEYKTAMKNGVDFTLSKQQILGSDKTLSDILTALRKYMIACE